MVEMNARIALMKSWNKSVKEGMKMSLSKLGTLGIPETWASMISGSLALFFLLAAGKMDAYLESLFHILNQWTSRHQLVKVMNL